VQWRNERRPEGPGTGGNPLQNRGFLAEDGNLAGVLPDGQFCKDRQICDADLNG
jgi:hypothetical protein